MPYKDKATRMKHYREQQCEEHKKERPIDLVDEEWKQVDDAGYYEVSSHGRIRTWKWERLELKRCAPKLLKSTSLDSYGYPKICLKVVPCAPIHKLVALLFIGPKPGIDFQVAHADGNKLNNNVNNLRWATAKENALDRIKHGTQARGESHGMAKSVTEETVKVMRQMYDEGRVNKRELQALTRLSLSHIKGILSRTKWSHIK